MRGGATPRWMRTRVYRGHALAVTKVTISAVIQCAHLEPRWRRTAGSYKGKLPNYSPPLNVGSSARRAMKFRSSKPHHLNEFATANPPRSSQKANLTSSRGTSPPNSRLNSAHHPSIFEGVAGSLSIQKSKQLANGIHVILTRLGTRRQDRGSVPVRFRNARTWHKPCSIHPTCSQR